jgi:hypothetical protein
MDLLPILPAGSDQFIWCGVLHTKPQFCNVLETIFIFRMCLAQSCTLKMCCRQISLKNMLDSFTKIKRLKTRQTL